MFGAPAKHITAPSHGSVFTVSLALPLRGVAGVGTAANPNTTHAIPTQPGTPSRIDLPPADAHGQPQPQADRHAGCILLAEDNPMNQEVMLAMLESFGIDVHCAENGHEAVAAAREGGFDMVLMDCQMPLMDGCTATGALRAAGARDRRFGPLPIVALTANAFAEDSERALAAGMNDFVAKPLVMAELHRVLTTWLPPASASPAAAARSGAGTGNDVATPPA